MRWFILTIPVSLVAVVLGVLALGPFGARAAGETATAVLIDQSGKTVGSATFVERRTGEVTIAVQVRGLAAGAHGIHVHAAGACTVGTSPAFSSAGSHFNPGGGLHGSHAGDLGNLQADARGVAVARITTAQFTLSAGAYSLLDANGSALVIHAQADDGVTDPTGNSGARVVCGVVAG